ncbi:hypothetical protein NDU88_009860 [Pleurodeles waltl]|uniref:Uncharacterized protein n=1 Tax=Pleurodeles waltl TaxID=8319 RepID=A0AAV7PX61_PLEWA|nr:hypothetical protein NDU88_009860 [Pleurodeles waltl]
MRPGFHVRAAKEVACAVSRKAAVDNAKLELLLTYVLQRRSATQARSVDKLRQLKVLSEEEDMLGSESYDEDVNVCVVTAGTIQEIPYRSLGGGCA